MTIHATIDRLLELDRDRHPYERLWPWFEGGFVVQPYPHMRVFKRDKKQWCNYKEFKRFRLRTRWNKHNHLTGVDLIIRARAEIKGLLEDAIRTDTGHPGQ